MRWDEDEQRGFALAVAISLAGHAVLFTLLSFAPSPKPLYAPASISVRLVAALPTPSRGGAARAAKSLPRSAPAPTPAPPPAHPRPVTKKRVLPRDPSPAQPKKLRRRSKPEEMPYEDAMAALRAEMGEAAPEPRAPGAPETRAGPGVDDPLATAGEPRAGGGAAVSPELARRLIATKLHVCAVWITPPDFLNRALSTELRVRLGPTGEVLGTPVVARSSGDPYWDDNAIRALMKASPLPAPPEPGMWPFLFSP